MVTLRIVTTVRENMSTAVNGACIKIDSLIFTWGLKSFGLYCIIHNGLLLFCLSVSSFHYS